MLGAVSVPAGLLNNRRGCILRYLDIIRHEFLEAYLTLCDKPGHDRKSSIDEVVVSARRGKVSGGR